MLAFPLFRSSLLVKDVPLGNSELAEHRQYLWTWSHDWIYTQ